MPRAVANHTHHCSCPKLPPDVWERIATTYSKYGEAFCRDILRTITGVRDPKAVTPSDPHAAHRVRILAKITPPDLSGHRHWTGRLPTYGLPRIMHSGFTRDLAAWLWLWDDPDRTVSWRGNRPMVRLCHDPYCVAPDHHRAPDSAPQPAEVMTAGLHVWEQDNPRPHDPRSTRWITKTDFQGERCLAGHRISVYSVRPRKSYCRECAEIMRVWVSARKAEKDRLDRRLLDSPRPRPNQPTYTVRSPEPEPSPALEPEDTLVGMLQRMAYDSPEVNEVDSPL